MKSLNNSANLWTNMSAKEVEDKNYSSSCCFNVRVNSNKTATPAPQQTKKSE